MEEESTSQWHEQALPESLNSEQATAPHTPPSAQSRIQEITGKADPVWPSSRPGLRQPPKGTSSAKEILRQMGQSEDPETRLRAAQGMQVLGGNATGTDFLAALRDPSPAVRQAAAASLLDAPADVQFAAVMEVLTVGADEEISAVEAVLPRLRDTLEDPMLAVLMDPNDTVERRTAAAFSAGRMRCRDAVRVLVDLSWNGEPLLSAYSADALAYLGDPASTRDLMGLLEHSDPRVRYSAVEGLGRIGGPDALDALVDLVTSGRERNTPVRVLATVLMGRIGGETAISDLIRAMAIPNPDTRKAAGTELRRLTGLDMPDEPSIWQAWDAERLAAQREQRRLVESPPPLMPAPQLELPPGIKPWYAEDDEGGGLQ